MVLTRASLLDLRTRKVPNRYWIALSLVGVALISVRILADEEPLRYLLVLLPVVAILADVFWEYEGGSKLAKLIPVAEYGFAIAATAVLIILWHGEEYFQHLVSVPVLMLAIIIMYMLDVIRGGADAKALIALSIMFPFYPTIWELPVIVPGDETVKVFFPFAFSVLVNAAVLVVFVPLMFLIRNMSRRDIRFPQMALGYMIDAEDVGSRFVWLLERVVDGRHVLYSQPKRCEDMEAELAKLKEHGRSRVWVTPKIPFIIPISAGFVFTVVVGNILFPLFGF